MAQTEISNRRYLIGGALALGAASLVSGLSFREEMKVRAMDSFFQELTGLEPAR